MAFLLQTYKPVLSLLRFCLFRNVLSWYHTYVAFTHWPLPFSSMNLSLMNVFSGFRTIVPAEKDLIAWMCLSMLIGSPIQGYFGCF